MSAIRQAPKPTDGRDIVIASLVFLGSVLLLGLTATQGFVRDEGYYFRAAHDYHGWFEGLWRNLLAGQPWASFQDATLTRSFGYNTEHPGFVKIAMGWSWKIFHGWQGLVPSGTGYRLASMIMVAAGNAVAYLLGTRIASRGVGILGVVLLMACPRVFYHAHLACFDAPIMAMTVIVVYAFWRSLDSRPWIAGAAVVMGIAVATKHNAVFLLPTLGLVYLLANLDAFRLDSDRRLRLPALPLAFLTMVIAAPVIFYIFYPYGWHDPIGRIGSYYAYHLHHEHYPVDFFGTLYSEPPFPWSFPFVMSGVTVPLTILVAGLVGWFAWLWFALRGSWQALRGGRESEVPTIDAWLLVISAFIPPLIIAVPSVPIFGGTKHWMPMMPFLCLLAAWTILRAAAQIRRRVPRGALLAAGLIALSVLLPVIETWRTHPLGNTYYNELTGGHQGAAALGMPRTFWGGGARQLLPVLNEEASRGAMIFTDRMNYDAFRAYQRDQLLRKDLRWGSDVRKAKWALVNHQREHRDFEYSIWATTGDKRPRAVVERDGVPIVSLYRLESPPRRRVALVVLDGFGLAAPGEGNSVQAGLDVSSGGVLARTLAGDLHPMMRLAAFGECVGLEPGAAGNSEAGHNNMCAGAVVPQRRVYISRALADTDETAAPHLFDVLRRSAKTERPLHVIAYLGDRSSVGHHEHLHSLLKLAKREGVRDVQVHGICRGTGTRSCRVLVDAARAVMKQQGIGRFSSIAGRKSCINRQGVTDGTRACIAGFKKARTGTERSLDVILDAAGEGEGEAHLQPEPIKGGMALTDDDDVVLMLYRRDSAVGITRVLRGREAETDPPNAGGPRVATFGLLDAQSRYDDDARLTEAFVFPNTGGMLHRRLAAAGVRQLRIAEKKKAPHVTYFCDGGDVPDGPSYSRVHPESVSDEQGRAEPCLRAEASVAAAVEAMQRGSADFIMMNLPNADLMGHTGDLEAARKGVACLDRVVTDFVARAGTAGYAVLITADHGNAEQMLVDGKVDRNHSANPVPFIAIAPPGKPRFELRVGETMPCIGDVTWTVLDVLGLPTEGERSLLVR